MKKSRVIAAGAALAALSVAMPASATRVPACQEVAFSPGFRQDRTMWCSESVPEDGAYVYRSTDAGRSWGRGVQVRWGTDRQFLARVIPSPLYPTDRRVLVWTTAGTYESVDGGLTFSTDPVAKPASESTPYVESIVTGTPRAAFVHGTGGNGTYDTELGYRDVVGVPGYHVFRYIVPPSFQADRKAVALALPIASARTTLVRTPDTVAAFACSADFACGQGVFDFGPVSVDVHGGLGRPGQHYLLGRQQSDIEQVPATAAAAVTWRSNDDGRTWKPWTSVDRILNAQRRGSWTYAVLTASPDSRRVFMSVASVVKFGPDKRYDDDDTYAMTLWRSDDDGSTWHRMSVPWKRPPGMHRVTLTAQAGNRLYATGSRPGFTGLFCSLDNGRTWRTGICR